ncbi:MAG: metallophosphoesterase [Planctomycetaceae bacterium]|nr:metallophosphoesterase [Planctomycetaceae bacterium]
MKMSERMRIIRISVIAATAAFAVLCAATQAQEKNVLSAAAWTFSGDGGKTFAASLATKAATATPAVAKATFSVEDLSACGGVWLQPSAGLSASKVTLNGKEVAAPLPGMSYPAIPLDPQKYLVKGTNVLEVQGSYAGDGQPVQVTKVAPKLLTCPDDALCIQSGPSLGAIGPDWFSVVCRTNIPATVTVTAKPTDPSGAETTATSPRGFYHRLKVPLAAGTKVFSYTVTSQAGAAKKTEGPFSVISPWGAKGFRFAATGDSRGPAERWIAVSEAIRKHQPSLVLFTGDPVGNGPTDQEWDQSFFGPGKPLLASAGLYPATGNHEGAAAVVDEMTFTAGADGKASDGKGRNWFQNVGDVLLIGIDCTHGWAADGPELKWLEGVLKDSKAKYIFLTSHYPGWTSGYRAKRLEPAMAISRQSILPLLAKYKATAMIVGHEHNYERNEIPAGTCGSTNSIVAITSAGAGAPLRGRGRDAEKYNPHSKAFFPGLHYVIFDVTPESCTLKAYSMPDNKIIDEATFKPRQ